MSRRLLAATIVALTVGAHSAAAAPILEVSINSDFAGDLTQTLLLPTQSPGGFDWNGFAIDLGLGATPGAGLYVTVQAPTSGLDTIYLRTSSPGLGGPANGNGGAPPVSNSFSLKFQSFGRNDSYNPFYPTPGSPNDPPNDWPGNPPSYGDGPHGGDPSPAPVPEPASLLLFGSGLAGAALAARRKRRS